MGVDSTYRTGDSNAVVCDWNASGYRLPTEAEWEKAARGGVSGKNFPWGTNTINDSNANYRANSSAYSYDTGGYSVYTNHPIYAVGSSPYSSPVGSFAQDGYGLYDMAGNLVGVVLGLVWELRVGLADGSTRSCFGLGPGAPGRQLLQHRVQLPRRGSQQRLPDRRVPPHRVPDSPQFSPIATAEAERTERNSKGATTAAME